MVKFLSFRSLDEDGIKKYHHVLRGLKTRKGPNGERLGYDDSEDVSKLYAVHFLPTKYLIDRDGNIVKRVTSADPGTVEDPQGDETGTETGTETGGGTQGGGSQGGGTGGDGGGGDGGDDLDQG